MRIVFAVVSATLVGACMQDAPAQSVEPTGVVDMTRFTPRADVTLPPPEAVTVDGRGYTFRFMPQAGLGYSQAPVNGRLVEGSYYTDIALVGGTDDKMDAVKVYLRLCHGQTDVPAIWGDEVVPRVGETGEWAFAYTNDCLHYQYG